MTDNQDINTVARRLEGATKRLHELAPRVGNAKAVREYDGDRRKNLLSKYVAKELKLGQTSAASESFARANPSYQAELHELSAQFESAEVVIAQWSAENCSFESLRSLLSLQKATIKELHG